jgi:hexokinase
MAHLKSYLQQLEQDFTIDTAKLKYVTNHFVKELEKGMTREINISKFHR